MNNKEMDIMNTNEECRGCAVYETCLTKNSKQKINQLRTKYCPCTICLVKVTCRIGQSCEAYGKWLKTGRCRNRDNKHLIKELDEIRSHKYGKHMKGPFRGYMSGERAITYNDLDDMVDVLTYVTTNVKKKR